MTDDRDRDRHGQTDEGPLETTEERRVRWRSIYVVYATMFVTSLSFSTALTGVWPYLDKLQRGAGKERLGLVVAAHPLGQLLASPLAGLWANRAGRARPPLLASLALSAVGGALYAVLYAAGPHALPAMLVARLAAGAGAAGVAVARSYLSAATLLSERTRAVAGVSLAQVLGFAAGPALQAAAAPLGPGPPLEMCSPLQLDMYTAAGWAGAALSLLNFALLLPWCFRERPIAAREAIRAAAGTAGQGVRPPRAHRAGAWTLAVAFFLLVCTFVLLETLATSLTMDQFAWSKRRALQNMGALMSGGALLACLVFVVVPPLARRVSERSLLVWGGFVVTSLGTLLCVPWGPEPAPPAPAGGAGREAEGGCPADAQPWCATSRGLRLGQFVGGYALVSLGYPLGVTLLHALFSKVVGARPQGLWMSVLTGAGCLARVLGPLGVAVLYTRHGPAATFGLATALLLCAALMLRIAYPWLREPAHDPSCDHAASLPLSPQPAAREPC